MTSPEDSTPTEHPPVDEPTVLRRRLLRSGAIVAGATVIGAAAVPSASAANGQNTVLGTSNAATATTGITVNGATGNPNVAALTLSNANGPSLALNVLPDDWDGQLKVGQMVATPLGPLVGIDGGTTPLTTYLATGVELDSLPLPVPVTPPVRLLDTRSTAGRTAIVRRSSSALDDTFRLKAGAWIDVAVDSASGDKTVEAAFLNVTATSPLKAGFLSVYPPGDRPASSTVNFATGVTVANGAFVGLGYFAGAFVVRIYASAATHVVLDVTGETISLIPGPAAPKALRAQKATNRRTRPSMLRGARSLSRTGR